MNKDKTSVISNLSWKLAERLSAQLVSLVVAVVLARLLDPSHYGIIAIVTIFITIANVLVSDGFGAALIQKKDADNLDFSSVLSFNIAFSLVLYAVLFFTAPLIALFYGDGYELLTPVIRVLGLRVVVAGINSVQQAYVARNMMFRKFFVATLLGTIVSGVVGIIMAFNGFGVWALVAQYMINTTVDTIVLGIVLKWWPGFTVSFNRLKCLIKYGWKILATSLLITGFVELRALIIGKMYSSEDLAYYDKGKQFPNLIVTNINASISAVLFARMSKDQDDREKIKEMTRKSIRLGTYILSPMMLGLAAVSTQFVSILLTDKWLPCAPLLQLFCIIYLFQPIHSANMQAIKAVGKSNVYLLLEIVKKTIELAALFITLWYGVNVIVVGMAIVTTLFVFVNAFPNKYLLNYTIKEQLLDLVPSLSIALLMFGCVFGLSFLPINKYLLFCIEIISGIIIYFILSIVTKNAEFIFLKKAIKNALFNQKDN